ncbi:MAG: RibD family protein, partial [Pelistega sp.]|nr:RibD family protein [Pelistega sp.]
DGQHWRARSSVVLTGVGTILKDNPLLNVRAVQTERQPIRAVIDGQFQLPEDSQLFNGDPVWIFTYTDNPAKQARLQAKNVDVIKLSKNGHKIDLNAVWQTFIERQVNEVHVEAGPGLNGALLEAGLIDELLVYMAPKIIGPGQSMFAHRELSDLTGVSQFAWIEQDRIGEDLRLRLRNAERWRALAQAVV